MESLEATNEIVSSALEAVRSFATRDKESELNKAYERCSTLIQKGIERTLWLMEKGGIRLPRMETPLRIARIALLAVPLVMPAQGEAKATSDAFGKVREAVEQEVKVRSSEASQAVKQEEGRDAAIENVTGQLERTMRQLASNPQFLKKHRAYVQKTGLTQLEDFYPLRCVIDDILNEASILFERYDLLRDEKFMTRATQILRFPPKLSDIEQKNREIKAAKSGPFVLTYAPDDLSANVEELIEWLYDQQPIKDLQDRVGDRKQLQMFEALIRGNKKNPLYERAIKEFDLKFLRHIPWDLVQLEGTHEYGEKVLDETAKTLGNS